jgi:hypothetical protein
MRAQAQQRTRIEATATLAGTLEEHVERALQHLRTAELEVLRARFGIGAPRRTRREIARRLGVSLSSVRRLERVALRDLRALALPSDVPRRASRPGTLTIGRSGEANRPAAPRRSRPPLPRPLSPGRQTPRVSN